MGKFRLFIVFLCVFVSVTYAFLGKYRDDKTKCPTVKAMRFLELNKLLGQWYVVQYYASSEEDLSYKCMRAEFTRDEKILSNGLPQMQVTMNFTYIFINDPLNEQLLGNITWDVPDFSTPAHWVHAEDTYEGVYNTYVLDTDYTGWTLLMHCAEKQKSSRYLSAFIMSRDTSVGNNVASFLRDKLPKYDIDLNFMFDMSQESCEDGTNLMNTPNIPPLVRLAMEERKKNSFHHKRRHPLRRVHRRKLKNTSKEKVVNNSNSQEASSTSSVKYVSSEDVETTTILLQDFENSDENYTSEE